MVVTGALAHKVIGYIRIQYPDFFKTLHMSDVTAALAGAENELEAFEAIMNKALAAGCDPDKVHDHAAAAEPQPPPAAPAAGGGAAPAPELEGPDPEFLAALPPDLRAEVMAQQAQMQQLHQHAAAQAAAAPGPQDMDMASILATFPPDLREEALLSIDDGLMGSLPPALLAEVQTARSRHVASHPLGGPGLLPPPPAAAGDGAGGAGAGAGGPPALPTDLQVQAAMENIRNLMTALPHGGGGWPGASRFVEHLRRGGPGKRSTAASRWSTPRASARSCSCCRWRPPSGGPSCPGSW